MVLVMFGFGILMVGSLWVYFEFQTRPFRDLTTALSEEFPEARPLVQGGQAKLHDEEHPLLLRILVTVPFNPQEEESEFEQSVNRIQELAQAHQDLSPYQQLEIHLIQRIPEQEPVTRTITIDL
ncbi:MAG: hypothetical protein R3C11_02360 [Planctomycetaceae bacterium]